MHTFNAWVSIFGQFLKLRNTFSEQSSQTCRLTFSNSWGHCHVQKPLFIMSSSAYTKSVHKKSIRWDLNQWSNLGSSSTQPYCCSPTFIQSCQIIIYQRQLSHCQALLLIQRNSSFSAENLYLLNASRTNKTSSSGIVRVAQREANTEKTFYIIPNMMIQSGGIIVNAIPRSAPPMAPSKHLDKQ